MKDFHIPFGRIEQKQWRTTCDVILVFWVHDGPRLASVVGELGWFFGGVARL